MQKTLLCLSIQMVPTDLQLIQAVSYDYIYFPMQLFVLPIVNSCICLVFYGLCQLLLWLFISF